MAGTAPAIDAKRKGGQAIENKQLREMVHFAPPMISRTYDQRRETARFARRKNPFVFAGFSASSRPKTQGSEINGGFGARAADVARVDDSEMAPHGRPSLGQPITHEQTQSGLSVEDRFTPPAQLIGSGGVKRRISARGESVCAPWRWWFSPDRAPGQWPPSTVPRPAKRQSGLFRPPTDANRIAWQHSLRS